MEYALPTSCEPDMLFEILADPRRRHLIAVLRGYDRTDRVFVDTLSSRLAAREKATSETTDEIALTLHHQHLPRLDEAELIRYEPTSKMVEFTDITDDQSVIDFATVIEDY
ncbi:DUF7344 domain-containing protein [Natronobacterium haloterrestre]|nr:hypothetical protein [Halobiforma haloterrestris]